MRALSLRLVPVLVAAGFLAGCARSTIDEAPGMRQARNKMVSRLVAGKMVSDKRLVQALREVPRQALLPESMRPYAYTDQPVAIDAMTTLSSPALTGVALQEMNPLPKHRVLMIDPPGPYVPAVAARMCDQVTAIFMLDAKATATESAAQQLGLTNVDAHACDIAQGWSGGAPYDSVLMNAPSGHVATAIVDQVDNDGVIVQFAGPYAAEVRVMTIRDRDLTSPRVVSLPWGS